MTKPSSIPFNILNGIAEVQRLHPLQDFSGQRQRNEVRHVSSADRELGVVSLGEQPLSGLAWKKKMHGQKLRRENAR
jgi:hypothetical protein